MFNFYTVTTYKKDLIKLKRWYR